jgi:hypothetical protein
MGKVMVLRGDNDRHRRVLAEVRHASARQALFLIFCALGHELGLTPEDILGGSIQPAA